ncbi:MAG: hypothetical protein ABFE01_20670 [Phycisphaerales bacterium]
MTHAIDSLTGAVLAYALYRLGHWLWRKWDQRVADRLEREYRDDC